MIENPLKFNFKNEIENCLNDSKCHMYTYDSPELFIETVLTSRLSNINDITYKINTDIPNIVILVIADDSDVGFISVITISYTANNYYVNKSRFLSIFPSRIIDIVICTDNISVIIYKDKINDKVNAICSCIRFDNIGVIESITQTEFTI